MDVVVGFDGVVDAVVVEVAAVVLVEVVEFVDWVVPPITVERE